VPDRDLHDLLTRAYCDLMSLAAHEFRTPASVIAGYLRMLQKETAPALSARDAKMIDEAAKSCARMVALIEELSEVAKLDSGRSVVGREPFDLFSLTTTLAGDTHEAADRGVHLQVRHASLAAPVAGDPARMRQAFSSFYRAVLREQPTATTIVADHALVPDAGRLFAQVAIGREDRLPEALASKTTTFDEARGGLGLALPIARRVIERHGGSVCSPLQDLKEPGVRNAIVVRVPVRQ
jgi:signal transduction histidine kinase